MSLSSRLMSLFLARLLQQQRQHQHNHSACCISPRQQLASAQIFAKRITNKTKKEFDLLHWRGVDYLFLFCSFEIIFLALLSIL